MDSSTKDINIGYKWCAYKMKICKHIVFFYCKKTEYRISYIDQMIEMVNHYPFETDIFVHTNIEGGLTTAMFQEENRNGTVEVVSHDLTGIHPWYLTWKYRPLMLSQRDKYDVFIYLEDDILIPDKAVQYWFRYKDRLIKDKYNLGFLRVEYDENNIEYCTDIVVPMSRKVKLDAHMYVQNETNPYTGFWIYDKEEFGRFIDSKYWDIKNIAGYSLRASSAIGLHGVETPWYKGTIIPVVSNNQIHSDCKVYHLPNNYALDKNSYFATMRSSDAVS